MTKLAHRVYLLMDNYQYKHNDEPNVLYIGRELLHEGMQEGRQYFNFHGTEFMGLKIVRVLEENRHLNVARIESHKD